MEALRNFVQHRGLPVDWASPQAKWTDAGPDGLLEFSIELATAKSSLVEGGSFKKEVLHELDERVDLTVATRRYIESLSDVQSAVRSLIQETLERSRATIEGAHGRYKSVCNDCLGLTASQWDEEKRIEIFPLLLDWDDIRQKLKRRNRQLTNLSKRYITSAAEKRGP